MTANWMQRRCALALVCLVTLAGCGTGEPDAPPPPTPADEAGGPPAPDPVADPESPAAAASGLVVAFMLDPRISSSVYMGERWVTPETFTLVHQGEVATVHARAHVVHPTGTADVTAAWTTADHEMLTVPLDAVHQAEITVHRPGQTTLTVTGGDHSTTLTVVAAQDGGSWRVDISQ
jgi:hypothetical protein